MSSSIDNIKDILVELRLYRKIDSKEYLNLLIQTRLDYTLDIYRQTLEKSYKKLIIYCESYSIDLMKRLNKNG